MKSANEDLEREIAAGRGKDMILDSVDEAEGKDYIEMVCFSEFFFPFSTFSYSLFPIP